MATDVAAVQNRLESGLDLVTAAAIRLVDGTPVTLAVSGVSPGPLFEINFFGERGRLRATDTTLVEQVGAASALPVPLAEATESIDGNFVAAVVSGTPQRWSLELKPREARLRELVVAVTVSGVNALVRQVAVQMADGDRSTMTIEPVATDAARPAASASN